MGNNSGVEISISSMKKLLGNVNKISIIVKRKEDHLKRLADMEKIIGKWRRVEVACGQINEIDLSGYYDKIHNGANKKELDAELQRCKNNICRGIMVHIAYLEKLNKS